MNNKLQIYYKTCANCGDKKEIKTRETRKTAYDLGILVRCACGYYLEFRLPLKIEDNFG